MRGKVMISVIIPVYNTEKYIKRCLDSVTHQTYSDLEILIVDDGSTDSSSDICKEYQKKDNRIKYIRKSNSGQGASRNLALDECRGEWISFVDSDDWIDLKMYEDMLSACSDSTDIVICGWVRNHGFKEVVQGKPEAKTFYNNQELIKAYLCTPYITSSMCNKIYRRTLFDGIRFPTYRAREDSATIYKILAKASETIHIVKPLYYQYVRPGSTERSKFTKKKLVSLEIAKQEKECLLEKYPEYQEYIAFLPAKSYMNLLKEIVNSFSYFDNKKLYNQLLNDLKIEMMNNSNFEGITGKEKNECVLACNLPVRFFICNAVSGVKMRVIDQIKKVYFALAE